MNVLDQLRRMGRGLAPKAPPIPVFALGGTIGHVEHRRGLYVNSALQTQVDAFVRDMDRMERIARETSGGRFGARELLPVARAGSDHLDLTRAIRSMRMAFANWDDFVAAKALGKSLELAFRKSSISGGAAGFWSASLIHPTFSAGNPAGITWPTTAGAAAFDESTTGALRLPMALGASDNLYLTNFIVALSTGYSIVLVVDMLVGMDALTCGSAAAQAVSTTTLPRWTGGAGVQASIMTTGAGNNAATFSVNYRNQADVLQTSPAQTMLNPGAAACMFPGDNAGAFPFVRLAAGDYGIKSISSLTFSATGGNNNIAAMLFKPLIVAPYWSTALTDQIITERSLPKQLGGAVQVTEVAQGSKPCIHIIGYNGTGISPSNGNWYIFEFIWG